ncbi:MAG: N-acetyltransferase [Chitinophagaceae bacterium]|nr:N-acetyltransferase [Chitinophagaceae bacterium]
MEVQWQQEGSKGSFFIMKEGRKVAEMTYTMPSTTKLIIDHTEVSDELRGQNAGYQLVKAAVDYARSNKISILPLCPFAASVFKKVPALADVLVK